MCAGMKKKGMMEREQRESRQSTEKRRETAKMTVTELVTTETKVLVMAACHATSR